MDRQFTYVGTDKICYMMITHLTQKKLGTDNSISIIICLWLWAASYVTGYGKTHRLRTKINIYKYVIQSVISREGLKLHAYNLLQIYSYLIAIRLPTPQCTASCFFHHFRLVLSTPQTLI